MVGFSVVVPSYNQARFIRAALNSLLEQRYPDLEIIVVDGGSTDGTIGVLRSYGDRIRWVSKPDRGQSDALVKGFALATKEWLTWLNSDDAQTNNALHCVNEAIQADPSVEVVIGGGHYIDIDGNYLRPYPTIKVGPDIDASAQLFEKGYVAQPSVYFRRTAYEKVEGINPELHFVMDYDLWVRLAVKGCRFVPVAADISGNRWYETTKTASQTLPLLSEVVMVQTREYGRVSPYFVQAISDYLYQILHSRHRGEKYHLLYRTVFFKSVWVWVNCRRPLYCLKGLIVHPIAKSGPVVGDSLTYSDLAKGMIDLSRRRWRKFLGKG